MQKTKRLKKVLILILSKIGLTNLKLKRKQTTRKELNQVDLWNSLEIPVKLFYEILKSDNLNLLVKKGKPSQNKINNAWLAILDEYWSLTDSSKYKRNLNKIRSLLILQNKHTTLRACVLLCDLGVKKGFEELAYFKIKSVKEAKRIVLETETKIRLKLADLNKEETKGNDYNFYKDLAILEQVLDRSIKEDVNLNYWIELNKLAKKISNERNKKQ